MPTSGKLRIGVAKSPPCAPSDVHREGAALEVVRAHPCRSSRRWRRVDLAAMSRMLRWSACFTTGMMSPAGRGRDADVVVPGRRAVGALVERGVELRVLQRRHHRLHDEGQEVSFTPRPRRGASSARAGQRARPTSHLHEGEVGGGVLRERHAVGDLPRTPAKGTRSSSTSPGRAAGDAMDGRAGDPGRGRQAGLATGAGADGTGAAGRATWVRRYRGARNGRRRGDGDRSRRGGGRPWWGEHVVAQHAVVRADGRTRARSTPRSRASLRRGRRRARVRRARRTSTAGAGARARRRASPGAGERVRDVADGRGGRAQVLRVAAAGAAGEPEHDEHRGPDHLPTAPPSRRRCRPWARVISTVVLSVITRRGSGSRGPCRRAGRASWTISPSATPSPMSGSLNSRNGSMAAVSRPGGGFG